jgi:hypothetical protein
MAGYIQPKAMTINKNFPEPFILILREESTADEPSLIPLSPTEPASKDTVFPHKCGIARRTVGDVWTI